MRAVDVEHVEAKGNSGDPLRLGDELLGEKGRGNGIQHLYGIEGDRLLTPELTRRQQVLGFPGRDARPLADLPDQTIAIADDCF